MHREAPFYLIAHSVVFVPMRANVTGFKLSPLGSFEFMHVDLK
jgi:dipeptide transport system substrate-binding protein